MVRRSDNTIDSRVTSHKQNATLIKNGFFKEIFLKKMWERTYGEDQYVFETANQRIKEYKRNLSVA